VVTPVIDYAVSRPDVDKNRIALWGISLGGYLAPRAAAYDHRISALIADGGTYDIGAELLQSMRQAGGSSANMTREELRAYLLTDPKEFNDAMRAEMNADTEMRWLYEHGMYVFNATSPALFWAQWMDFTMEGSAERIRCPTLVTSGETDHFDPNSTQARMLYDHLTCPKELVIFSGEYEAGYHCQMGAFAQSFERKFDWLDEMTGKNR
jgi:pimeloyl-ACP methyl ester carboxylesterase